MRSLLIMIKKVVLIIIMINLVMIMMNKVVGTMNMTMRVFCVFALTYMYHHFIQLFDISGLCLVVVLIYQSTSRMNLFSLLYLHSDSDCILKHEFDSWECYRIVLGLQYAISCRHCMSVFVFVKARI